MEFLTLGPLAVTRDNQEIDLGPPRQRALLALLLIHAGEVLSTERILEDLWGTESVGKLNSLRVHVSRLRATLEPDRQRGGESILETVGGGYRLGIDPEDSDAGRFMRAVAEAREVLDTEPAEASRALGAAIGLWRGEAYEEFAYDDFAQLERRRLHEARIGALEDRIGADLAVGRSGDLVSEIERLRREHPLRERLVEHEALALYRSGRAADALRAVDRFRRYVGEELGIDPSPSLVQLEEQLLLHDERVQPRVSRSDVDLTVRREAKNPFKGLRAFGPDDTGTFFGRDHLVTELLRRLTDHRLVALVGSSGSGKSSAVRAGLGPALAKGSIEGSDRWLVATMVPGAHPFAELEAALVRSTLDAPGDLTGQLAGDTGLLRAALQLLPDADAHLLLVIDQFEELFTLVEDDDTRVRFLTNLVTAVDDPHGRISVVVTLRADFYGDALTHPAFGARLGSGIVNVTPLSAEELEHAALAPAEQVGVGFEPALLGRLISDVERQPGALPLFQYALTELFDRRADDTLTTSAYRAMGGLDGVLQRKASDLFDAFSDDQQEATRQLFLRLVAISHDDQRSRRRVPARDIASLGVDTVSMQEVIGVFGQHRLLSFDSDRLTGAPTVEVAHEALLTTWPRLEGWIDESREDIARHRSLAIAESEWRLADEDPAYLLPPARLAVFEDWDTTSRLQLNDDERRYLEASHERREADEAESARQRRAAARGKRRLWSLIGALGGTLAVAALFMAGVFAPDPGPTITYFGQRNPDRVSDSIKSGVDQAVDDFGLSLNDVRWTVDLTAEFEEFAQSKPSFVIGDSSMPFESQIYRQYPDIRFGVVDPTDDSPRLPNVSYVEFRNEEGGFLAGVAAASTTETGIVGFVGGMRIPLIEEFRAGFEAGVESVDPDIEVLATFVSGNLDNGFANPNGADARATELYERGADVVFHAAGLSGQGVFRAADRYSDMKGTQVWGIGVDVDQWFDLSTDLRAHVLTSIIKRQDTAAYVLAENFANGGPDGLVADLGLAERGYDYTTSGDALSEVAIALLDQSIDDVADGHITVPTTPAGEILRFDGSGDQVEFVPNGALFNPDFEGFAAIDEGVHPMSSLGVPLTVEIVGDWKVQVNMLGHTAFSHPDSVRVGDRDVVFLRPSEFADPSNPGAAPEDQVFWTAAELDGLDGFEGWLAELEEGIISTEPTRVRLAGREAIYFEAELGDSYGCGAYGYCAGFLINVITAEGGISGWAFEPGFHQRIWVVDGGEHPPLVIVASTVVDDRSFQAEVDDFLGRIMIGEPGPHPLDPSAAPTAADVAGTWTTEAAAYVIRFNPDGTYEVALTEEKLDTSPVESGEWSIDGAVFTFDTAQSNCPGILDRPALYRVDVLPGDNDVLMFAALEDPCLGRLEAFAEGPVQRLEG